MPDSQNCTGRDFSVYDAMDDEQLRQILRDDASNTEGEDTDMELMLHIMEVLAKRRKEAHEDISPEEALEKFKNKYTYTDISLISEERPAKRKTTGFSRWQRWVATIAAVLILVFGTSLTAQALGFDIFEIIVKWTQETFHFGSPSVGNAQNDPATDDETPYKELSSILKQNGIEAQLVPSWIPDGYTEASVKIQETPTQRVFSAVYESGEKSIRFRIADYLNSYPVQVEQSDELLEVISREGIEYYLFKNYEQVRVVWIYENYECYIIGELSESEMKEIISSIKKG